MQEYPSESDGGGSSEEEDTVCRLFFGVMLYKPYHFDSIQKF